MAVNETILIELLKDVHSWTDLKPKLSQHNTAQTDTTQKDTEAGKLFEFFSKAYFTVEPEQSQLYKNVWLFNEIPLSVREKLNFRSKDFGIDLVLEDFQGRFTAVQCKFKNDEQSILQWSKDKLGNAFGLAEKCDFVLVFTNVSNVHSVAKDREKLKFIGYSDFVSLKHEDFEGIRQYFQSHSKPTFKKLLPLNHQNKAISQVVNYLEKNSRAQLILPCGAGKTLTALWIKEQMAAKNTLVLFPSLALLRQFKTEWSRNRSYDFEYICVCSEKDIDKSNEDSTITHTYEISGEVTTNPDRVNSFLDSDKSKIIFSTYQSLEVTEKALKKNSSFSFDLIICDEAHRTAGSKANNLFTIVHDNDRIRGNKRLYMTATPKVVSSNLKTRLGEEYELLCDMSNSEIFGGEAYRMSFWEAIQEKILVNYKIIGIGVTHKQVKEFIEKRRYVTSQFSIDEIAHNYALDIAMNKYNAFHSITFHHRVSLAREFSERHKAFFKDTVYSQYVEGNQPTSHRASVLNEFKNSPKGVVSNARCLTEGVDVPTIDLIYFCDPKNSKIDIVQASGRALRKDWHGKKTEGYIVIPIFHHKDDDIEKEIERKPYFQNLVSVIRSLCDQDERLQAEIDNVAFEKGEKVSKRIEITFNDEEIENIIKLDGLEKKVRDFLFDQIIEKTKNSWNVRFEELKRFKEKYNTTDIGRKYDLKYLRWWCQSQRDAYHKKDKRRLNQERIKKLESIGFDWKGEQRIDYLPPDQKWKRNYEKLKRYFDEHGNTDIKARYKKDKSLATWCVTQRVKYDSKKLSEEQIDLLEQLHFKWAPKSSYVPRMIEELKAYKIQFGNIRIATQSKTHPKLGRWINKTRMIHSKGNTDDQGNLYRKGMGEITKSEIEELNNLGFVWTARQDNWDDNFFELKKYFEIHGHSEIESTEDQELYYWCWRQKKREKRLTPEQREKFASINFNYSVRPKAPNTGLPPKPKLNTHNKQWDEMFERLKTFKDANENFEIPKETIRDKRLYSWAITQRIAKNNKKLPPERIEKLDQIEFPWSLPRGRKKIPIKEKKIKEIKLKRAKKIIIKQNAEEKAEIKWVKMFHLLWEFVIANKNTTIPRTSKENTRLAYWLIDQRKVFRAGRMSKEKAEKFKTINVNLAYERKDNYNKIWLTRYNQLKEYFENFGDSDVSSKRKENKTLGTWVTFQRMYFNKGELSDERIALLNKLNFSWSGKHLTGGFATNDDLWLQRLNELKAYKDKFGDTNVSQLNKPYYSLARWVNDQRVNYKREKLSPFRIEKLNGLNFIWEIKEAKYEQIFNERFNELVAYHKIHKDFKVPQNCKEFPKLGSWVSQIRHRGTTPERKKRLDDIGFNWKMIKKDQASRFIIKTSEFPQGLYITLP